MKLYVVRHGQALSEGEDSTRPLSEKGKAEVSRMAKFLKASGVTVDRIWCSTKIRASQTAAILARATSPSHPLEEKQKLGPNDPLDWLERELTQQDSDLMVVGHLPFLQNLTSLLLTGGDAAELIHFQAGGVVCLERAGFGAWQLDWIVQPELLR